MRNIKWLKPDVQVCIEPPPTPLVNMEAKEMHATYIIKVEVWINPSQSTSETYKINISTLEYGQPEEILALLRKVTIKIDKTGTTTASGRINYLRTMLSRTDTRSEERRVRS